MEPDRGNANNKFHFNFNFSTNLRKMQRKYGSFDSLLKKPKSINKRKKTCGGYLKCSREREGY